MDKTKVCKNCRTPLGFYKSKYCERCAPYVYRMNKREKELQKRKRKTNPFFLGMSPVSGCKVCGKIKNKSEFVGDNGFATCRDCKNIHRRNIYIPKEPRPKKEKPKRYCECGRVLEKGKRICGDCKIEKRRKCNRERMRVMRAHGFKNKPTRSAAAKTLRYRTKKIKREHKKRALPSTLTGAQWENTLIRFGNKCAYCGSTWESRDHFIPMSLGGGYTRDNIVPACSHCNSVLKNSKLPGEFIGKKKSFEIAHTLGVH